MTFLHFYTVFHTALSIVAVISGLLVVKGLLVSHGRQLWTLLFLVTATATTVTGFFFPFEGFTPAFILGIISVVPLTLAILARYRHRLKGSWRGTYVINCVIALYFNCFVLVVQSFEHIPSLNVLAPTQKEPPFAIAQLVTLVVSIAAGFFSYKNYHPKNLEAELSSTYVSPRIG